MSEVNELLWIYNTLPTSHCTAERNFSAMH